jgi:uncharacterized caspase-like protein/peptidoglycan hydrolase-like protein with peptidoglycan-binding domain
VGAELFQTIGGLLAGFVVGWATPSSIFVKRRGAMTRRFFILSPLLCGLSLAIGLAILLAPDSATAAADKRVALVIGNGAYKNAPRLDNPTFDAKAVAHAFRRLGFQVVDGYDLDIAQMRAKVSEFSALLPDAKSAVVYYAGHGVSVDDENYLIPTDIVLKSPTDLDLGAIGVSLLLKQMKREDRVNVVILDACRDNPFATALAKNKTRAIVDQRGLSRIDGDLARGTLIAFASDPKSIALDGPSGQHSPFTEAFLDHVADPGVSIDTVMSRVRTEVWEKTKHNQLPWVNTSLIGDYALNPQASSEAGADVEKVPAGAAASHEDLLWESAQHSNLSADYQAYLEAFPNGLFAQMAKNRIASLEGAGVSGAAPAPETSAPAEPAASSEKDFKSEIGTVETEKALNLTPENQTEIQQRLIVLEFYKGAANGALDSPTRSAIAAWQESRGLAPTSFLGSLQLAALRAESESMYQRYLAAQPAPIHAQGIKQGTRPTTSAAKAPAAPARHWAHRSPLPVAAAAASASATPDPGGTPAWRRRAGLPDNSPTQGRPPGY